MNERKPASDNAEFDIHATDPMRLKQEVRKTFGLAAAPEKTYECKECDREVKATSAPKQCPGCSAYGSMKEIKKP